MILKRFDQDPSCKLHEQRSHNLRKFSQIYAVSMGALIVVFIYIVLSYSIKFALFTHKDMEINCETAVH